MNTEWKLVNALRDSLLWTASSLAAIGKEQDVITLEGRKRTVGEILDEANKALNVPDDAAPTSHPIPTGATGEDEQAAFEDWMERTCPSGDVEAVQRQWESSSDYADFHAPPAGDVQGVPAEVMAALDRMCTPLDQSWLKGVTAEADAKCMQTIRDYILHRPACAPAAGDALDLVSLLNIRFTPVSEGLPDLVEYSPSYAGQWSSNWCVVITARGNIESSRLVLSSSGKEALEAARFNGVWRAGMGSSRVVAWAYMDHIRSAADAAIAQQSQRKEA